MKTTRTLIGIATITLAAGAAVALAASGGPGGPGQCGRHERGMRGDDGSPGPLGLFGRGLHRLDLSEEQQTKIDALFEDARPAIETLRDQLHEMQRTFRAAQSPGTFDEAAIRAHAAKRAVVQADLAVKTAKIRADVFAVLTPEQQTQLAEMKEECSERGSGRRRGPRW